MVAMANPCVKAGYSTCRRLNLYLPYQDGCVLETNLLADIELFFLGSELLTCYNIEGVLFNYKDIERKAQIILNQDGDVRQPDAEKIVSEMRNYDPKLVNPQKGPPSPPGYALGWVVQFKTNDNWFFGAGADEVTANNLLNAIKVGMPKAAITEILCTTCPATTHAVLYSNGSDYTPGAQLFAALMLEGLLEMKDKARGY
jgi:hypothetical protein